MAGKKRGQNEGSIYKKKDGRYGVSLSIGGGRRVQRYASTMREAQQLRAALLRDYERGTLRAGATPKLTDYLTRWVEETVRPDANPRTYQGSESKVRVHLIPRFGHLTLRELTPQHVQAFSADLLSSGYAPATVSQILHVLSSALGEAQRWGLVDRNAAALIRKPRVRRREVPALSADQAQRILAAFEGKRMAGVATLALYLGLRNGEVRGLRWQDVNVDAGMLAIRVQLQHIPPRLRTPGAAGTHVTRTKSGKERPLPILPPVHAALEAERAHQDAARVEVGTRWVESGHVFTTQRGRGFDARWVRTGFHAVLKNAGLPPMHFHDLRHGTASLLAAAGVHPKVAAEILGHADIAITTNVYTHVDAAQVADGLARLSTLLSGEGKTEQPG